MFTRVEAHIPLRVPGDKHPIKAVFSLDADTGEIKIVAENYQVCNHLLEIFRINNVVTIDVNVGYIPAKEA